MKVWLAILLAALLPQALAQGVDSAKAEARILQMVNAFRAQSGRDALAAEETLSETARDFARYMARTGRYGHEADGREPAQRAEAQGYRYCMIAENIAYQFRSDGFALEGLTRGFVKGWIDSPGHRANMLAPVAVETGIGIARSEKGVYYAVQLFGRPRSLRVAFQVENRSGAPAQYKLGEENFALPVRATRTHEQCSPAAISVEGSGAALRLMSENGARYVIIPGGRLHTERGS